MSKPRGCILEVGATKALERPKNVDKRRSALMIATCVSFSIWCANSGCTMTADHHLQEQIDVDGQKKPGNAEQSVKRHSPRRFAEPP